MASRTNSVLGKVDFMRPVHVFVSARPLPTGELVCPDYEDPEYHQDLAAAFAAIGTNWKWVPVSLAEVGHRVEEAKQDQAVVLNLCDGDASQGLPGVEVIRELEAQRVPYTGADRFFYDLTTSRHTMKTRFRAAGIPQSDWVFCESMRQELSWDSFPAILKPDVSGGSYGIEKRSVVSCLDELREQMERLFSGDLHGRDFRRDGAVLEEFIDGPEYSVLVLGDWNDPASLTTLPPVERFFADAWPKVLTYEINWERYEEGAQPPPGPGFWHGKVESATVEELTDLAIQAFVAAGGTGYGRVDIRRRGPDGRFAVLEVNANCGLSSDPHTSTVGAILSLHRLEFGQILSQILRGALSRFDSTPRKVAVFIPALTPDDPSCWGYGEPSFCLDFEQAMERSGLALEWHKICRPGFPEPRLPATDPHTVVFNLCDGDDATYPGISVVQELEKNKVAFTGAKSSFYRTSTSKTEMKRVLARRGVATAPWAAYQGDEPRFFEEISNKVGFPCLFKPDISAGSFGIRKGSRVATAADLAPKFAELRDGSDECQELTSGWFAEAFVSGREFTVLVSGSADRPQTLLAHTPLEYRFADQLPPEERFLFYARRYETDAPQGEPERYQYAHPEPELDAKLRHVALAAYAAVGGHGYARVDLRQEEMTGIVYVLEVNANCGLGCDPLISTMGAILTRDRETYATFLHRAIGNARNPGKR